MNPPAELHRPRGAWYSGPVGIGDRRRGATDWLLAVALPLALVGVILFADHVEGPKTAYVGVLTAVPMLAAVFGTPRQTALVGGLTWLAALWFGTIASDGNVGAQQVRLLIIALAAIGAVAASAARERRDHALAQARREVVIVHDEAEHDPMTGVLNRRGVLSTLDGVQDSTWTVALVDVDGFKDVNDEHGHSVGDEFLTALAQRIDSCVAGRDLVARWGGDEFLVALKLPPSTALAPLERVLRCVSSEPVATSVGRLHASVTIGVGELSPGETLDDALTRADRAMYRGKAAGRSRLVLHTDSVDVSDEASQP
jgi:diguanylate cyclase (GGDEF)-like protein